MVNGFWRHLFNDTVYMEFPVCFSTAKYENDTFVISFSLCETSNAFIDAFCYSRIHFHQSGPLKLIKTVEIFTRFVRFISSMESLSKG